MAVVCILHDLDLSWPVVTSPISSICYPISTNKYPLSHSILTSADCLHYGLNLRCTCVTCVYRDLTFIVIVSVWLASMLRTMLHLWDLILLHLLHLSDLPLSDLIFIAPIWPDLYCLSDLTSLYPLHLCDLHLSDLAIIAPTRLDLTAPIWLVSIGFDLHCSYATCIPLIWPLLRLSDLTFIAFIWLSAIGFYLTAPTWLDLHCLSDLTSMHSLHLSDLTFVAPNWLSSVWFWPSLTLYHLHTSDFDLHCSYMVLTFVAPMSLVCI